MIDFAQVKTWRQELHQIPEVGLQEHLTCAYLKDQLEKMGYESIPVLDTGILVYIDNNASKTIAFRSDIDALAIEEDQSHQCKSKISGMMHACGHDGHMSALLGLAALLKKTEKKPDCNVLLIFQPAEESPGGARLIVEQDILEKYNVKAIFGMHLMPSLDQGVVGCRPGPLMAQAGELDVTIEGKSAHAGLPHLGIDTVNIAANLLGLYQQILPRQLPPFEPCVLNIGKIEGGTVRNIVAAKTKMEGTLRAFNPDVFAKVKKAIFDLNAGFEKTYDCKITTTLPDGYPPVINDKNLYRQFVKLTGNDYLELEEPMMLAEDFAFYQTRVPGIFFFMGTRSNIHQSNLHTATFDFDEAVLLKAIDLYANILFNINLEEL